MSRQDANAAFALSSFLQGTNATYIDDLYARYERDPASVDTDWQAFFKSLKDSPADVQKNAGGASWGRDNWPVTPRDELTSALDGNWVTVEKAVGAKLATKAQAKGTEISAADLHQATRDSVRALMLIRAYRMRGHFHAKLDPLGIEAPRDREERAPTALPRPISTARSSSTTCSASNTARFVKSSRSASAPIARRSASSSCTSPTPRRRPGSRSASKVRTRKSVLPAKVAARSSTS
jgi:hypothetical protein